MKNPIANLFLGQLFLSLSALAFGSLSALCVSDVDTEEGIKVPVRLAKLSVYRRDVRIDKNSAEKY